MFVKAGKQRNGVTVFATRPQFLAEALAVVLNDRIGGGENRAGGTIILLQANNTGVGKVLGELLDILDTCAPPAVNGLVVVADGGDGHTASGKNTQPGILHCVGVLEFVHQNMFKALLIVAEYRRVISPQLQRSQQQLGEVYHPLLLADFFIAPVYPQHGLQVQIATGVVDMGAAAAFILVAIHEIAGLAGRPASVVKTQFPVDAFHHSQLIVAVEDLEVVGKPGFAGVGLKQPVGEAVKGSHPHTALYIVVQQFLYAGAHLPRGLVGKGHRHNAVGRQALYLDFPGNAVYQHAGFATSGAGQYQRARAVGGDGVALSVVELIENIRYVHGRLF